MCRDALVAHDAVMHPELSSSIAQIRFREVSARFGRRGRASVASDAAIPPPRERDPVGREQRLV